MNLHYFEWFPKDSKRTPVILFLHGMGGTGSIWRPVAAQLEDDFRCVAPDQRGHGQSRPVPFNEAESWRATDYARDVLGLIRSQGWTDILVVGHSMGARTALALGHLALNEGPQTNRLIREIVCVDIGLQGAWGGGMGKPLADFLENLPREFPNKKSLRDYVTANCPDPAIAQYLSAVAKNIASGTSAQSANAAPTEKEKWVFPFDHESIVKTIHQANAASGDEKVASHTFSVSNRTSGAGSKKLQSNQDRDTSIEDHFKTMPDRAQLEYLPAWTMQLVNADVPVTFLRGATSKVWPKIDYEKQRMQYQHKLLEFQEWENCGHGLPFEQRTRFVEFVRQRACR